MKGPLRVGKPAWGGPFRVSGKVFGKFGPAGQKEKEMELLNFTGAVLLALLVMVLPALAHKHHWTVIREDWRHPLRLLFGVLDETLGAVTVTYYVTASGVRIAGSTTGPTGAQAAQAQKQSAVVVFGVTADIQALFTHNWGLELSAGFYEEPEVLFEPISTTTYWPLITFWRANSNVLSINKLGTDAPTTVMVTLRRPGGPWQ
jgi:hypothetical protein